jgi:hypothetical protein
MRDGNELMRIDELPPVLPGEVVPATSKALAAYSPDGQLIEGDPVATSQMIWAWQDSGEHHFQTSLTLQELAVWVSTVYLGFNHQFSGGPPLLWETMATSDGDWLDLILRYTTRAAAMAAHRKILGWLVGAGARITESSDNYGVLEA